MKASKVFVALAIPAVLYGAAPLFTSRAVAADVCCFDSDDCPSSTRCRPPDGPPCDTERTGTCVPIVPGD